MKVLCGSNRSISQHHVNSLSFRPATCGRSSTRPAPKLFAHKVVAVAELSSTPEPATVNSKPQDAGIASRRGGTADLLLEREQTLKDLLEPGNGLPPKASVVSALRKEIASLRQQLSLEIGAASGEQVELEHSEVWESSRATPTAVLALPSSPVGKQLTPKRRSPRFKKDGEPDGKELAEEHLLEEGEEEEEEEDPSQQYSYYLDAASINADATTGSRTIEPEARKPATRVRAALKRVEERLAAQGPSAALRGEEMYSFNTSTGSLEASWGQPSSFDGEMALAIQEKAALRGQRLGGSGDDELDAATAEALQLEVLQIENARLRARLEELHQKEDYLRKLASRHSWKSRP